MASNEYDCRVSGYFCQACKSEISFEQKVIRESNKWYHSGCLRQEQPARNQHVCQFCKLEVSLEQRTVQYENRWYHMDCIKQNLEMKSGYFCQACKSEISFEQKVIRESNKWYHSGCLKQETENKEFEKLDEPIFEKPIKESIEKTEETPVKSTKKEGVLCAFCRDIIADDEESIKNKKKKYHAVCFQIYDKNPVDLSAKTHKKESNNKPSSIDPVLIIIMSGIFVLLFYTAYRMLSGLSLFAIIIGIGLAFYHIIDSARTNGKKKKRNLPSYFIFITLIMPIVFGAIVAFDGFSVWYSIPKAIIVWGLTLTFWSNMVFVPLSVYSKSRDVGTYGNTYNPFVSVIIPAYNEEKVIRDTIESVLATDYQRREVIVIDDGSKDRTFEIASEYKGQIKALHKENGGKPSALNYGLLYAKGQIIISIDADTILAPQAISALVEGFKKDKVGALAGNIKVRNRSNWITRCQALEYVAGIQIFRRTLDFFDAVPIVPGALGAFRKDRLHKIGNFSKDTLAEDFDATLKILKSGDEVGGVIDSKAYTEAPNSIRQFYRQRKRWYRGDMQVLLKHKNSLTNPRFGTLYKLTYPLMIMSMFVTPFSGLIVWAFAIVDILGGGYFFVLEMMLIFIVLQHLQSALAIRIEKEDPKLIAYSAFFVVGYKQIIDVLLMRAAIETLLKRKTTWTSVKRIGRQ